MDDPSPEVLVAVFDDATQAGRVERELAAAEGEGLVAVLALAVVARAPGGGVEWHVRGAARDHLATRASIVATMLGVLLPAPVELAGLRAATEPGPGGRVAQREFEERFAHEIAGSLDPGGSVVVAVIHDRWTGEVARGLRGYHRLARDRPGSGGPDPRVTGARTAGGPAARGRR